MNQQAIKPRLSLLPCEDDVLQLRPVGSGDEADLLEIYADPGVMQFASDPVFHDIADVRKTILSIQANLASGEALELGIVVKSTGKLIGVCSLHSFVPKSAEVGYLLNRRYWRRGFMQRALHQLIAVYAAPLELTSVTASVERSNVRSVKTLESLGFRLLHQEGDEQTYGLSVQGASPL